MAKYFQYFPKTFYTSNNNVVGVDAVTNIITRFAFDSQLKENSVAFYPYQVQDSDTPEIVADKYYGDSEYHWVVLLFNDILDPQFDWPLSQNNIIEYINKKYSANGSANTPAQNGITWALSENNVQAYFKVITTTGSDGTISTQKIQVDANTYANVVANTLSITTQAGELIQIVTSKEKQSYYTYEVEENEKKREIKLLKRDFLPELEKEFKRVVSLWA